MIVRQLRENLMTRKTFHVYLSDKGWVVQKEGASGKQFSTQRQAIEAAREIARSQTSSQVVVHGQNGQIREHTTYGMPPIQDPPKKSSAAKRIERAVGAVALERVKATSTSAPAPKK